MDEGHGHGGDSDQDRYHELGPTRTRVRIPSAFSFASHNDPSMHRPRSVAYDLDSTAHADIFVRVLIHQSVADYLHYAGIHREHITNTYARHYLP